MKNGSSMLIMEDDVPTFKSLKKKKKMTLKNKKRKKVSPRSPRPPLPNWSWDEKFVAGEEENKIPVKEDYDYDGFSDVPCEVGEESEEELILDSDRNEVDYGCEYVIRKKKRTITNPRNPRRTYIPRSSKYSNSVIHDKQHALSALAKLALARYNEIRGTRYQYVGLVKAYNGCVGGFIFWIRFKAACLPGTAQPPINFEAVVYQRTRCRSKGDVAVEIQFVYPLP